MAGQAPDLRLPEVFPQLSSPTDAWKPLLKAVRANSLTELERRVNAMSYPENVCSIHFPLKVVPDPEHDELPCTEWFAYKPSGPGRQTQTDAFMPLLFAAVHNVYRWGEGFVTGEPRDALALQSQMSLDMLDFVLRHGGDPHSSCFLGLELMIKSVQIAVEPSPTPLPRGETQRRAWLESKKAAFQKFFTRHRLSPLRRNIRVTRGEYAGRFLFEAYGDLVADDELQWEAELPSGVELTITASVADWHFAPVVACDVESKENYLYIPIGGQRAPLDYTVMLKEYAARMRWSRTCAAVDEVLRRFHAWVGHSRVPQMVLVPSSMQKLLVDLYTDHSTSDVVLEAEGRKLHAHRLVLSAASPYFQVLLNGPFREGSERCIEMRCDFEVLEATLKFVYTGKQDDLIQADPLRVLPVAHRYGLDHLQHACELNAKADLHLSCLGQCLRVGHAHGAGILRRACFDFIARNPARCMLRPEVHTLRDEDQDLWQQLIAALGIHDAAVLASATASTESLRPSASQQPPSEACDDLGAPPRAPAPGWAVTPNRALRSRAASEPPLLLETARVPPRAPPPLHSSSSSDTAGSASSCSSDNERKLSTEEDLGDPPRWSSSLKPDPALATGTKRGHESMSGLASSAERAARKRLRTSPGASPSQAAVETRREDRVADCVVM